MDYDEGMIEEIGDVEFKREQYQNYNQLTSSFKQVDETAIQNGLSGSNNLKVDYNEFSNHVHFGSAVSKIDNFKLKASQIEDQLVRVSQSLNTGSLESVNSVRSTAFKNIQNISKKNIRS